MEPEDFLRLLFNMIPSVAVNGFFSRTKTDWELICNMTNGKFQSFKPSHFSNILFGDFALVGFLSARSIWSQCLGMFFAFRLSALGNHVGTVFQRASFKEVVRIAARWIVAIVASKNTIWNISFAKLISNSVGKLLFPVDANNTVASFICSTSPRPTSIITAGFINEIPYFFRRIFRSSHVWDNTTITN
jgi:hypothetical protein